MIGSISEAALAAYTQLVAESLGADFSEGGDTYDFTRCVRPDGTVYGSRGKCKQGVEQSKSTDDVAKVKPTRSTNKAKSEAEMNPDERWERDRLKLFHSLKGMSKEQLISRYRQTSRLDLGSLKDTTIRDLKGAIVGAEHGWYSPSESKRRREERMRYNREIAERNRREREAATAKTQTGQ